MSSAPVARSRGSSTIWDSSTEPSASPTKERTALVTALIAELKPYVPVLVDENEVVNDSHRIRQYLDWKYGEEEQQPGADSSAAS